MTLRGSDNLWAPLSEGGGVDSDREAEVMAQLLVFAEQTTDFVGVSDPWGRVIFLNSAACKRLGVAVRAT